MYMTLKFMVYMCNVKTTTTTNIVSGHNYYIETNYTGNHICVIVDPLSIYLLTIFNPDVFDTLVNQKVCYSEV